MDEINLEAADRWRKEHSQAEPMSGAQETAPGDWHYRAMLNRLETIDARSKRQRTGLALALGFMLPGAGPLFMGAYPFAILYLVAFVACSYEAVAHVNLLKGQLISAPWLWGAVAVWLVSFIHTAILTTTEE